MTDFRAVAPAAFARADVPDPYAELRAVGPVARAELAALAAELARAAASGEDVGSLFAEEAPLARANGRLIAAARALPEPQRGWVLSLAGDVASLSVDVARRKLSAEWAAGGGAQCLATVAGRYPFDPGSSLDVPLADFERMFAAGGVFDRFFEEKLARFVDTTASPWSWRGMIAAEQRAAAAAGLKAFESARKIRDALLPSGTLKLSFGVTPVALSEGAGAVQFEVGTQRVTYYRGPIAARTIVWPDPGGVDRARIGFVPGGPDAGGSFAGPWAAHRLIGSATSVEVTGGTLRATFAGAGAEATFDISVGAVNPFALPELATLRCPAGL